MSSTSAKRNFSGKVYDPVFLCMLGAVILAVASSIALRTMVSGPTPAHASEGTTADPTGEVPSRVPAHVAPGQSPRK